MVQKMLHFRIRHHIEKQRFGQAIAGLFLTAERGFACKRAENGQSKRLFFMLLERGLSSSEKAKEFQ